MDGRDFRESWIARENQQSVAKMRWRSVSTKLHSPSTLRI